MKLRERFEKSAHTIWRLFCRYTKPSSSSDMGDIESALDKLEASQSALREDIERAVRDEHRHAGDEPDRTIH